MKRALEDVLGFTGDVEDLTRLVSTRNATCHPPIDEQLVKLKKVIDQSDLSDEVKAALRAALQ